MTGLILGHRPMTKLPSKPPESSSGQASGQAPGSPVSTADIAALPFEAALKELEQIVDRLEKGAVELEESIAIYARGEALKAHCNKLLTEAEEKIRKITLGPDGHPAGTEPLDVE